MEKTEESATVNTESTEKTRTAVFLSVISVFSVARI
jgi:hypothetical protein